MKVFVIILIGMLLFNTSNAKLRRDLVEVRGVVKSFDKNYVYMNFKGKKTVAPRSMVTQKQLKSKKEIRVLVDAKSYFQMQKQIRKNKKNKYRRAKK